MKGSPGPREAAVIGGSSGSLEALAEILPRLPGDYGLAVIVIVHQYRHGGRLEELLASRARLPVSAIQDKDAIQAGRIYICPANYHLLLERERTFTLSTDAKVHFARPSIDVAFESAARAYRERLVGVLLSGSSADGAAGLRAIQTHGGLVACQDPATASNPTMPRAGLRALGGSTLRPPGVQGGEGTPLPPADAEPDLVGTPEEIALWLSQLRP